MSARLLSRQVWCVVLRMAAGALLAGVSMQATLAQQPAASGAGGAAHAARSGENKGGVRAPQLTIAPAKERSIVHGRSNVVDRNAIGVQTARPDDGQRPAELNISRPAAPAQPAPSGGTVGLGSRGFQGARVSVPGPRLVVLSRGTLSGAAFTRPGTTLKPIGGPGKPAATSINGTGIRPKY